MPYHTLIPTMRFHCQCHYHNVLKNKNGHSVYLTVYFKAIYFSLLWGWNYPVCQHRTASLYRCCFHRKHNSFFLNIRKSSYFGRLLPIRKKNSRTLIVTHCIKEKMQVRNFNIRITSFPILLHVSAAITVDKGFKNTTKHWNFYTFFFISSFYSNPSHQKWNSCYVHSCYSIA